MLYVINISQPDIDLAVDSDSIISTLRQDAVYAKLIPHNIEPCAQELAEGFHALKDKQSSEKGYTHYLKIISST